MSKMITAILIAAFIAAIVLAIQPVTDALGNLINSRAISESHSADIANRLNEARVNYQVTELEMRKQILPLIIPLEFAAVVIVVAILIIPASLIYAAFVRKLFITVANPRSPWITVQTQLPPAGQREPRAASLPGKENDRVFYQNISRLYRQVIDNPNLPTGDRQVILAYLAALLRAHRRAERIAAEVDPYSFDYE